MRTLLVVENITLDGVMQGPGRPDEDERDGFTHGGWAARAFASAPRAAGAAQAAVSDGGETVMLFGRRSYLDLLHQWLDVAGPNPFAESFRRQRKVVVSTTLAEPLPFEHSELVASDVEGAVRALKTGGDGTIVVLGSGALVRSLAAAGLVDAYLLTQVPVVLGSGARLFGTTPMDLEVRSHEALEHGITITRYDVRR